MFAAKTVDMTITVLIILSAILAIKILEARKWKRKAASAFFAVGQRARSDEEREWGYGNSYLAGNSKAEKYYFYSVVKKFMRETPLEPFTINTKAGQVPCIFYDYYIPKRDHPFITYDKLQFCRKIFDFKDGIHSSADLFKEALYRLHFTGKVTIIFMPCSTKEDYLNRYSYLSKSLNYIENVTTDLYAVKYMNDRESKHFSRDRTIQSNSNISISPSIIGKNVIILDDVITTGNSLKEFAEELHSFGVNVVGAVFLAKTIKYPSKPKLILQALKDFR